LPFFVDALPSLELLTGLGGVGATDDDDDGGGDFLPNGLEKPNLEDDDADAVLAGLLPPPPPLVFLGLLPSIAWTAPPSSSTSYTKLNSFIVCLRARVVGLGWVCLFVCLFVCSFVRLTIYPSACFLGLNGWRMVATVCSCSLWGGTIALLMHAPTSFSHACIRAVG
jgi:hypothetical protein